MNCKLTLAMALVMSVLASQSYALSNRKGGNVGIGVATGVVDTFECNVRLWGAVENQVGPVHSNPSVSARELMDSTGPTLETLSTLGSRRMIYSQNGPVHEDDFQKTEGFAVMTANLGDSSVRVDLAVSYEHKFKADSAGKITEAYQRVIPCGTILKNNYSVAAIGCDFPAETGWEKVEIVNNVPTLKIDRSEYVETPGGSGIVKFQCTGASDILFPVGPVKQ